MNQYFNMNLLFIPYFLNLFGFIALTFIPGFLILRVLNIRNLDKSINLIFSIALSIFFIMTLGFVVNLLLPLIGNSKPISALPLFYSYNFSILLMLTYSYYQKEKTPYSDFFSINFCPLVLIIFHLPFISIIGSTIMTFYDINTINIILFALISITPSIVLFKKTGDEFYPLIIYLVSFSTLYNLALISNYIWGYDSFFLFFGANKSIYEGIWTLSNSTVLPLLLSSILLPIYSLLCDLEMVWVFKLMNPFIYSFVPVTLYSIYKKINSLSIKYDSSIAFLSTFVFMFYYGFSKDLPNKQHIAELFLALILLLSLLQTNSKRILLLMLCFSLVSIHYGISYLFVVSLLIVLALRFIFIDGRFSTTKSTYSSTFILFFIVLSIYWYLYTANGHIFTNFVTVLHNLYLSFSNLLQSDSRSGISYALYASNSNLWAIYKLMHILLQFFIGVGIIKLVVSFIQRKVNSKEKDFFIISLVFYMYLLVQTLKSAGMGFDRILQISLIFLSPIAYVGFEKIIWFFYTVADRITNSYSYVQHSHMQKIRRNSKTVFSMFLIFFFFFNSGIVFEIAADHVPECAISLEKNPKWNVFYDSEISNIKWLQEHATESKIGVNNDWFTTIKSRDGILLRGSYDPSDMLLIHSRFTSPKNAYIFLGYTSKDKMVQDNEEIIIEKTDIYKYVLSDSDKIYVNGKSVVYYSTE